MSTFKPSSDIFFFQKVNIAISFAYLLAFPAVAMHFRIDGLFLFCTCLILSSGLFSVVNFVVCLSEGYSHSERAIWIGVMMPLIVTYFGYFIFLLIFSWIIPAAMTFAFIVAIVVHRYLIN